MGVIDAREGCVFSISLVELYCTFYRLIKVTQHLVLALFLVFFLSLGYLVQAENLDGSEPIPKNLTNRQEPAESLLVIGQGPDKEKRQEQIQKELERQSQFISLFFTPEANKIQTPGQVIEYDLTESTVLKIGPLHINSESVSMSLTSSPVQFEERRFGMQLNRRTAYRHIISFKWPMEYISSGYIELINDQSQVLWRKRVREADIVNWQRAFNLQGPAVAHESSVTGGAPPIASGDIREVLLGSAHHDSKFGLVGDEVMALPLWQLGQPFRFCVTQDSREGRLAACTQRYRLGRRGSRYVLQSTSRRVRPRVFVNDSPVTMKGSAIFLDDKTPIKFSALLADGTYFEFISSPKPVRVLDIVVNNEKQTMQVIGMGATPLGKVDVFDYHDRRFLEFFNFLPTIGEHREFWRTEVPLHQPYIYLQGYGGAPFKQSFLYEQLPTAQARVRVSRKYPRSTYSRVLKLSGEVEGEGVRISSQELRAQSTEGKKFNWDYLAAHKGQMNHSMLEVQEGNHTFYAVHDVYRGFAGELSARMTGVLSNDMEAVLLGELGGQYWFESLLGWQNSWLSRQRWGLSAKYFQVLGILGKQEDKPSLNKFEVVNADLKYRLTPGVWGRDASLGLMLSYQSLDLERYSAKMAGGGVFWARSMPSVFDQILNVIPIFRYPKWVNTEFILYPLSMEDHTQLGVNMAINFQGKIQWWDNFFGEAGFGLKSFEFRDQIQRRRVGLGVAYGTMGIGYNF